MIFVQSDMKIIKSYLVLMCDDDKSQLSSVANHACVNASPNITHLFLSFSLSLSDPSKRKELRYLRVELVWHT